MARIAWNKKVWTPEDEQYLRDNWLKSSAVEMRNRFGVSEPTIRKKATSLGIPLKHNKRVGYKERHQYISEKICIKCGLSGKLFGANRSNHDNLNHYCDDCKATGSLKDLIMMGDKRCATCNVFKPRDQFYLVCRKGDKWETCGKCRSCNIKVCKEKYWKEPEKRREKNMSAYHALTPNQKRVRRKYCKRPSGLTDMHILYILAKSSKTPVSKFRMMDNVQEIIELKRMQLNLKKLLK